MSGASGRGLPGERRTAAGADPLLDRPAWAPAWVPSVDDVRQVRLLRSALVGVLAAGLAACVLRGADQPADPVLGPPEAVTTTATTTAATEPTTVP